jgi:transcriptional regulator with XRE-family HTH domain
MKSVHNPKYSRITAKLTAARKQAGLTQQQLADHLGKPQSFVSKLERGERRLDVLEFLAICEVLMVDPATFLTTDEDVIEYS